MAKVRQLVNGRIIFESMQSDSGAIAPNFQLREKIWNYENGGMLVSV